MISVGLHTCETLIQKQCEGLQTLPRADTDPDHNLLVAKYLHASEENFKVPNQKTTMGFGKIIAQTTKSPEYSRRETRCNWM